MLKEADGSPTGNSIMIPLFGTDEIDHRSRSWRCLVGDGAAQYSLGFLGTYRAAGFRHGCKQTVRAARECHCNTIIGIDVPDVDILHHLAGSDRQKVNGRTVQRVSRRRPDSLALCANRIGDDLVGPSRQLVLERCRGLSGWHFERIGLLRD